MRITLVNQYYEPDLSPTAHLCASLAEHRADGGDDVTVITTRARYAGDSRAARDPRSDPRVWRAPAPTGRADSILSRAWQYVWFYLAAGWKLLTLRRQDVIVCMTTPPYIAWLCVFHKWLRRRTRIIQWNMDCYPDILEAAALIKRGGLLARVGRALNRGLYRHLDHVVCLDEAMKDVLLSQYAPSSGELPMTIIPNWERSSLFPLEDELQPGAGLAKLGLDDQFIVLYLGNAGFGHRFDTVIEVAEALRDEPITFLFVGGGSQYPWLEQAREERGLKNLRLHGYVPKNQLRSLLPSAHLAVITLSDEALGLMSPSKLHSYLAMKLPVIYIGPAGSNVDRAIQTYGCGVCIRHHQAEAMAGFVREMMSQPERLAKLRLRARKAFEEAYCDLVTLPQFDRVIDSLVVEQPDIALARNTP